jgi:hypothetical protein
VNIETIENKIIEKLKSKLTDLLIDSFPEKPQEFVFTHPKGAILVHYQGGSYGNIESVGAIFQNKKMEFALTVVTRNLRTKNSGAYALLEEIKSILTGFQIDGCSKMSPTKEGFLSENNGVWQYSINFEFTTPSIESEDE